MQAGCWTSPTGDRDFALGAPDSRSDEQALEREVLLTQAANAGDVEAVARLLELGADPDGISGTKARRIAYATGQDVHRLGVRASASPLIALYARGYDHDTEDYVPLPAEADCLAVARLLLAAGADPDIQGGMGIFALDEAVEAGQIETVKLLIQAGADVNLSRKGFTQIDIYRADTTNALGSAIDGGHYEIIQLLLEAGADPYDFGWGMNALQRCAHRRDADAMAILLASMDENNRAGAVALSTAMGDLIDAWPTDYRVQPQNMLRAKADWFDCFRMLVERGATLTNVHHRISAHDLEEVELPMFQAWLSNGYRQGFALNRATGLSIKDIIYNNRIEPWREALAQGLDPADPFYAFGENPRNVLDLRLFDLTDPRTEQMARLLVESGMDLDLRDSEGNTLLHLAVRDGSPAFARYLIEKGAEVNALNDEGYRPIDDAGHAREPEAMVKLLREHGAKPGEYVAKDGPDTIVAKQDEIKQDPRLERLMSPVQRREALESLIAQGRYVRDADDRTHLRAGPIRIGRVMRYELPVGPPAYIVFDADTDADGRSAFLAFRGDGAMLPRTPGEVWRLKPQDVVDLDGDGASELLIDITLRDNVAKIGGVRIVSLMHADRPDWVVLHPHRDEPGAFARRISEEYLYKKTRTLELGPLGDQHEPLWAATSITFNADWLIKHASQEYGHFSDASSNCWLLIHDTPGDGKMPEAAEALAERMYPDRYR